ncbi:MAG TPA: sugar dehydratase, partial [Chloroflexota bacterium]
CGAPLTALAMVGEVAKLMDRTDLEPVILNTAQGEIPYQALIADKARATLAWEPNFTLEDGLRETIAWYQDFLADD